MDVFKHTEALGIPLEIVVDYVYERNCVIDWLDFYNTAMEHKWNVKTAVDKIEYTLIDVLGKQYTEEVMKRLKHVVNNQK